MSYCGGAAGIARSAHAATPPDPLRTESALRGDTRGLSDPFASECALPAGALTFSAAVNLALCRNPQTRSAWAAAHEQDAALGKTAQDNLQVALERYQAGGGTILDVLTAQTAALTARQQRINAKLGWKVARAQLALALGRLSSAEPLRADLTPP